MAIIKPSERFSTHKIGSSSDPTKPVGKDDYVIVESADATKYPNGDDRVRVAKQRDIVEDYFGIIRGKNLYNPADAVAGSYIGSTGNLASNVYYLVTGFIPVSKLNGDYIYINKVSESPVTYNAQYNINKEVIAGTVISGAALDSAGRVMALHEEAAFVRYTLRTENQTNVQVEYGEAGTPYVPWTVPILSAEAFGVGNVKYYGAAGNGVHNDTSAFNLAISAGHKVLYVPKGTYIIDGITIPASASVSIIGEDMYKTIIKGSAGISAPLITIESGASNLSIKNVTLSNAGDGLSIYNPNYINICSVHFLSIGNALMFSGTGISTVAFSTYVMMCVFRSCTKAISVISSGSDYLMITGNWFIGCSCALYLWDTTAMSNNNTFSNNHVDSCGSSAYAALEIACNRLKLVNNTINHSKGSGVKLYATEAERGQHIVSGNHIVQLNGQDGDFCLGVFGINRSIISNNYTYGRINRPAFIFNDAGAVPPSQNIVRSNVFVGPVDTTNTGTSNLIDDNIYAT